MKPDGFSKLVGNVVFVPVGIAYTWAMMGWVQAGLGLYVNRGWNGRVSISGTQRDLDRLAMGAVSKVHATSPALSSGRV